MDDNELDDWEKEAMSRAERRFPLSKPDLAHEFSDAPQLAVRLIRGTYFSIHDNRGLAAPNIPEKYRNVLLLIHSEKNRFRFLCDQLMSAWLPELPEFTRLLADLEPAPVDRSFSRPEASPRGFDPGDDLMWQAESFGIAVHEDCYRVGYMGGGPGPMFISKDLLLGILELVAEGLTVIGENLEFHSTRLLQDIRDLKERVGAHQSGSESSQK